MNQDQHVRDILVAITSVRSRAKKAKASGDILEYDKLLDDLLALEKCLLIHTELLLVA